MAQLVPQGLQLLAREGQAAVEPSQLGDAGKEAHEVASGQVVVVPRAHSGFAEDERVEARA